MPEQFGEKSQDATPFRRQQAREQGEVARSQDLASALLLIGALALLLYLGSSVVTFLGELTQRQLSTPTWQAADRDLAVAQWNELMLGLGRVLLPMFGLLLLTAIAVNLGQVGFLFVPQKLAFDLSRIDPLKGASRLFSITNAIRLAFGIFKILVVAAVALWSLWGQRDAIMMLSGLEVPQIALFVVEISLWTCMKIGVALLVLAIFDFAYQRWKHEQDLRMTPQEVREEMKTLQGDPQILARRRAIQRQLVLNRLSAAVPRADVVVTNPTELAIALKYDLDTMAAPVVVAKGAGVVAQRIRRLALENGIPIVERKALAQVLYKQVEVNHAIPAEQYAAMAEVLRYVYQLKGRKLPKLKDAA
jgi:flagellar biosynthetic protein FlhB